MQYSLKNPQTGEVKNYEVSYSQVLQEKTNKLLTTLIILIFALILIISFVLVEVKTYHIVSRLIYGF